MQKLEFINKIKRDLSKAIIDELPFLSVQKIKEIIKNKDVRVNKQKITENQEIEVGDSVIVYYQEQSEREWYSIVYVDDNILVVNKRAGIEVVSESDRDLLSILAKIYPNITAVHRLDRNTEGLVVFALNSASKTELLEAFKSRKGIIKKYVLLVEGRVDISKIKRTVYLKKVDKLSKVWISEVKTSGYEQIITDFCVVEYKGNQTLLEATLVTGKTHQIRAHIAYYNHPIIGDGKYGKSKDKALHLTAYQLIFNFERGALKYLNNKSFEIIPTWLK